MITLPLFYYPSTLVWVDDDTLFLRAAIKMLRHNHLIKTFNSPLDSLEFLRNHTSTLKNTPFLQPYIEAEHYNLTTHKPVYINNNALQEFIKNSEKTSEVSVLILDYHMQEMNGIELCRKLHNLPMKKILLTGQADHTEAIEAFNEGIIDRFIRKDSPNIANDIQLQVKTLIHQYFIDNTQPLYAHLEANFPLAFSDPEFTLFFKDLCESNHILEYYLLDKQNNFLLINDRGEDSYLIIHTEQSLNNFTALYHQDLDAEPFIKTVKTREKIPFFGNQESWTLNYNEWTNCFHSSQILQGREKYYWAICKN